MNAVHEPRLFFVCPDTNVASGGIMMIYRNVDHLVSAGIQAAVLHSQPGFRCTWFANTTPVEYTGSAAITSNDLIVIPEIYGRNAETISSGIPYAILNQNCHFTFLGWGWPNHDQNAPHAYSSGLLGVVAVSRQNHDYIAWAFPGTTIERIAYGIDTGDEPGPKKDLITFMPRKNSDQAEQVLNILAVRGALDGFQVCALDGMSHEDVIANLRKSRVFLSFGYPEGNGLPVLEALVAECVVIGYDGYGGDETLTPNTGFPVPYGDILEFAKTAESVITALRDNPGEYRSITEAGRMLTRNEYSMTAERDSVVSAWKSIIAKHPGSINSSDTHYSNAPVISVVIPQDPGAAHTDRITAELLNLQRELSIRDQSLQRLQSTYVDDVNRLTTIADDAISARKTEVAKMDSLLAESHQVIESLQNSWTWKLTRPIRHAVNLFRPRNLS